MSAPSKQDLARVGPVDAGDEIEERRLAGAVRADHADDLVARSTHEVELVDHREPAEGPVATSRSSSSVESLIKRSPRLRVPKSPCGRTFMSATSERSEQDESRRPADLDEQQIPPRRTSPGIRAGASSKALPETAELG